ncbi:hypothetical protein D5086_012513 [Populus alba]|uniref:Uncharacterized protein n=1 Tax=Populus alba TaxID=43335 RepID=A0ACC4C2S1_POPAL
MAVAAQTPDILGDRQSGQNFRTQNVVALFVAPKGALLSRSPSGRVGANKGSHGLIAWSIQLHEKVLPAAVKCAFISQSRLVESNIVKSSLGLVGLDKMLVDDIGDVTITNDGATILKMLEVEHPAAKVLVELAELQDREVKVLTNSVY